MKRLLLSAMAVATLTTVSAQGLKDAIGKYCLIGAAVNQWQSDGQVPQADAVLSKHFNCVVAENCMKPEVLAPAEGIFDFRVADKFGTVWYGTHRLLTGGSPMAMPPVRYLKRC